MLASHIPMLEMCQPRMSFSELTLIHHPWLDIRMIAIILRLLIPISTEPLAQSLPGQFPQLLSVHLAHKAFETKQPTA